MISYKQNNYPAAIESFSKVISNCRYSFLKMPNTTWATAYAEIKTSRWRFNYLRKLPK
jgi:hypothetical protein